MKKLLFLAVIAVFVVTGNSYSQGKDFSATGFRGLELDKSSPDDAVKKLGEPTARKVKTNSSPGFSGNWWIDLGKFRNFELLTYKDIEPYKSIDFFFVDKKLVSLVTYLYGPNTSFRTPFQHFECGRRKLLIPDDLDDLFGVKFKPHHRRDYPETPEEFEKYVQAPLRKGEYMGTYYNATAITEKAFIFASIKSVVSVFPTPECSVFDRKAAGLEPLTKKTLPGQTFELYMFSRTLEKK